MPDRRTHRGPHPDDARLFSAGEIPRLQDAEQDLSWLLSRGYAPVSALKLVGDRYALEERQRTAVARCSCSEVAGRRRHERCRDASAVAGRPLSIDGYNVLTSVEAALAGGVVLQSRDTCFRDMASMHGTWRKVEETLSAIRLVGETLVQCGLSSVIWYLDRPVSNSGRLQGLLQNEATQHGWKWDVQLVPDPDRILSVSTGIVATADSAILDCCQTWFNLARHTIERRIPQAWLVNLSGNVANPDA